MSPQLRYHRNGPGVHGNLNLVLTRGSARTRAVGADQALREAALPGTSKLKVIAFQQGVHDAGAGDAGEPRRREGHIRWHALHVSELSCIKPQSTARHNC